MSQIYSRFKSLIATVDVHAIETGTYSYLCQSRGIKKRPITIEKSKKHTCDWIVSCTNVMDWRSQDEEQWVGGTNCERKADRILYCWSNLIPSINPCESYRNRRTEKHIPRKKGKKNWVMSYTCTLRCIILSLQQKRWSIIQTYIESQYYLRPKRKNLFPYL
jgi:hypothetical protein